MKMVLFLTINILFWLLSSAHASKYINIPTDSGFSTNTNWFDDSNCKSKYNDRFYFNIGERILSINKNSIAKGIIGGAKTLSTDVKGNYFAKIPAKSGCKSQPFPLAMAEINTTKIAQLPEYVVVSASPPRDNAPAKVTKYIKHLTSDGSCYSGGKLDLFYCLGNKIEENGKKTKIIFWLPLNNNKSYILTESGIPMHARCEDFKGEIMCKIKHESNNGVTIISVIDLENLNKENITKLYASLNEFLNDVIVK